jgi:phenylacetate-CoA ligase
MPVLSEITGRIEERVYGPDGRRTKRFNTIFHSLDHVIREAQVIQKRLDHLHLRVVPQPGFGPDDERDLIGRIQGRFTERMQVTVEQVEHIERTRAGKFKAVISELSPEELNRIKTR